MRVLIACLAAALSFVVSCHEEAAYVYVFTEDCTVTGVDLTAPREGIVVSRGHVVMWRNASGNMVTIKVTDADVLGGRESIRLGPGEWASTRVGRGASDTWDVRWVCWRVASDGEDAGDPVEEGDGGSPGRTDDPPPN